MTERQLREAHPLMISRETPPRSTCPGYSRREARASNDKQRGRRSNSALNGHGLPGSCPPIPLLGARNPVRGRRPPTPGHAPHRRASEASQERAHKRTHTRARSQPSEARAMWPSSGQAREKPKDDAGGPAGPPQASRNFPGVIGTPANLTKPQIASGGP